MLVRLAEVPVNEPDVIADERDYFKAALNRMKEAFVEACQLADDWEKTGKLQHSFFDGYQDARRLFGTALLMKEIFEP